MKKVFLIITLFAILYGCKEEGPFINFEEEQDTLVDTLYISTTPIQQVNKNVLFEEFSGVRCSNCPAGNQATHTIYQDKGDRFVPVTVHSDFLAYPYSNTQDLRTAEANEIANSLGPVGQKPAAFISRKVIGSSRLQTSLANWSSTVDNVLAENSVLDINLEISEANVSERTIRYRVTLSYSGAASNQNLGFFLTESEIVATQLDGSTEIENYVHEFVLRKAITPIIGSPLPTSIEANTVIIKEFEIDLDNEDFDPDKIWDINHMHLVAFVRLSNDDIETAIMKNIVE
ncbi:MAG: Omp28-related outer membrane protein [Chitinophagales bacterium]|nr:Omp28-related outer membrane protein [Bacteroidota bacterium]MCB9227068.1 Omp28-related outer membrane protein [Chitinophagales bacterium]